MHVHNNSNKKLSKFNQKQKNYDILLMLMTFYEMYTLL